MPRPKEHLKFVDALPAVLRAARTVHFCGEPSLAAQIHALFDKLVKQQHEGLPLIECQMDYDERQIECPTCNDAYDVVQGETLDNITAYGCKNCGGTWRAKD